jgi:UV DNA damage endonuclease
MTEYEFEDLPNFPEIQFLCEQVGDFASRSGQRLSFHPGHFDILAAHNPKIVDASIRDLDQHGRIMDLMKLRTDRYNTINIHVGGAYGDKTSAMERFCENFKRLKESTQQRLTVENDDKASMFSTLDLYEGVHKKVGIPIVFDYLHHTICNGGQTEKEAIHLAATTWPIGIKPVTHYSSSKKNHEDPKATAQSHASYIYEKIEFHDLEIDVEIESKAKEKALFSYLEQFC